MKQNLLPLFLFFLLPLFVHTQVIQLNKELIFHAPFDGEVKNISETHFPVVFSNATFVEDQNGTPNSAVAFNGSTDYISYNFDKKKFSEGGKTISFWVYLLSKDGKFILSLGNNSKIVLGFYDLGRFPLISSGDKDKTKSLFDDRYGELRCWKRRSGKDFKTLKEKTWYQLTYLFEEERFSSYIDGEEFFSCTSRYKIDDVWEGYLSLGVNHIKKGRPDKGETQYFYGYLDELRIYDRILNQDEIKALHRMGKESQNEMAAPIAKVFEDVDENIPVSRRFFEDRFALVIGNEDYGTFAGINNTSIPNSLHSKNDANIFAKYASGTLGVNPNKIFSLTDGSEKDIMGEVGRIKDLIGLKNGSAEVFVYYSGHMLVNADNDLCIVPINAQKNSNFDLTNAIRLKDIYAQLNEYPASKVIFILDGCYDGFTKTGEELSASRRIIRNKGDVLPGNMVVFTAASEGQRAFVHNDSKHGIFTFFFLQKLKQSQGRVSWAICKPT
jgi:hypothetical protein